MKALKKAASLVLTLSILLSLVVLPANAAANNGSVSINRETTVTQGEKFSVDLVLADNPGFGALQARVYYDTTVLEIGSTDGTDFVVGSSNFTGGMLIGNTGVSANKDSAHTDDKWNYATVNVIATGAFSGNGTLITLNFTAKSGLESCKTPLDVEVYRAGAGDGTDITESVVANSGSVTINGVTPEIDTVTINQAAVEVNGETATPNDVQLTVTSKRGSDMTANVNYSVSAVAEGETIDASGVTVAADGKVTVAPKAKAGTYTIAVAGNGTTSEGEGSATLTVTRAAAEAKSIAIYQRTTVEGATTDTLMGATGTLLIPPESATEDNVYTFVVKSTDQYDDVKDVTTAAEDWTFTTADEFVTFANGVVTVKKGATADKDYTLKAKSGTLESATVTLTSRSINTVAPTVTINEANLVYGHKWSEIVTLGTDGSADLNGTDVPGTFSIVGADTCPDAGEQTFAVVYNSTDGVYKNIPVTLKAGTSNKVTIEKKALTINDSGVVVTKEYDETTAAGTVTGTLALTGVVGEDEVSVTGTLVASDYPSAGKGTYTVTLSGYSLTGADAGNYTVPETHSFTRATITGTKPILGTHFNISVPASKTYDGQASAASVTDKADGLGTETITYAKKNDDGTYATASTTAPVDAGTYRVIVSFAEGANFAEMTGDLAFVADTEIVINKADRNLTVTGMTLTPDAPSVVVTPAYDDLDKSAEVIYTKTSGDATALTIVGNTFTATGNDVVTVKVEIAEDVNYNAAEPVEITVIAIKDAVVGMSITPKNESDKLTSKLDGKTIRIVGTAASSTDVPEVTLTLDKNLPDAWKAEQTGSTVKVMNGDVEFESYSIDMSGVVVLPENVTITTEVTGDATVDEKEIEAAVISSIASVLNLKAGDTVKVTVAVTKVAAGNSATVRVGYTVTPTGGTAGESVTFTGTLKAPITITLPVDNAYAFAKVDDSHYFPVTMDEDEAGKTTATWKQDVFTVEGTVEFVKKQAVTIIYTKADGTKETVVHDFGNLIMPTDTGRGTFLGWTITADEDGKTVLASGMRELTAKFVEDNDGDTLYATSVFRRPSTGGSSSGSSSSSSASGRNAITVRSSRNGSVKLSDTRAKEGDTVTITVTPRDGYVVDEVTVTDRNGNNVRVRSGKDDDTFTFTMPETAVTVEATFVVDDGSGSNEPGSSNPFYDVNADAYYYDAVLWAVEQGVTAGTTDTTFSPNNACTRAQTVTFLWRAAGSPAPSSTLNPFTDVVPGSYYYDAVLWAVEQGITTGLTATTFGPNATVNRGQVVTFLYRSAKAEPVDAANPFSDVPQDAYYTSAVLWAVTNGITNGTTDTTFAPGNACTRAQIVTFLYRHFA